MKKSATKPFKILSDVENKMVIKILWDYENAPLPLGFDVSNLIKIITAVLRSYSFTGEISFVAVVSDGSDKRKIHPSTYKALSNHPEISLVDLQTPDVKQASDEYIYRQIHTWSAINNSGLLVLIAGDGGYPIHLTKLRNKQFSNPAKFFQSLIIYPRYRTAQSMKFYRGAVARKDWESLLSSASHPSGAGGSGGGGSGGGGSGGSLPEREKERIRIGKELLEAKRMEEENERKRGGGGSDEGGRGGGRGGGRRGSGGRRGGIPFSNLFRKALEKSIGETVKPISLEAPKAAEEMVEKNFLEERMEREREKERIRIGKELLEAKRMEEENERKRIMFLRKAEKEEEKLVSEKIRQKLLEEDKAERRRKLGLPPEDPTTATAKPSAPVVEEKERISPSP